MVAGSSPGRNGERIFSILPNVHAATLNGLFPSSSVTPLAFTINRYNWKQTQPLPKIKRQETNKHSRSKNIKRQETNKQSPSQTSKGKKQTNTAAPKHQKATNKQTQPLPNIKRQQTSKHSPSKTSKGKKQTKNKQTP